MGGYLLFLDIWIGVLRKLSSVLRLLVYLHRVRVYLRFESSMAFFICQLLLLYPLDLLPTLNQFYFLRMKLFLDW